MNRPQQTRPKKPTVAQLAAEVTNPRERVEDLEDLRDLNEAVRRNGTEPLIPWAKVKKAARPRITVPIPTDNSELPS